VIFNLGNFLPVILVVFGAWLVVLSLVFYLLLSHYQRLSKGAKKENLQKILDKILKAETRNRKELASLKIDIKGIKKKSLFHIQKIGFMRFNPFNETGGEHSFSLAILDGESSGVVITGLHARERTRIYVKPVKKGESSYELSREEERAIEQAKK